MADKATELQALRGGAALELGGQTRHLRYDFNALAAIEEKTKLNMLDGTGFAAANSMTAALLRVFIWAGLLNESPEVTIQDVGGWLTPAAATRAIRAFNAAMNAALSSGDEASEDSAENPPQSESRG